MRPRLGVVADDITGSGDIGGLLAKHGYAVRILSAEADWEGLCVQLPQARTDVLIIDTDSRFLAPEEARARVVRATRALQAAGCAAFWKKTCSVFRGNVGVEFDAMLDTLGLASGVVIAAFPKNGRTTLHGDHFVRGISLPDSEFGADPVHPLRERNLRLSLSAQTPHRTEILPIETVRAGAEAVQAARTALAGAGARYILLDAETQEDLQVLAQAFAHEPVFLGSSGLAEELPAVWPPAEPVAVRAAAPWSHPDRVILVAGSVMPQTRAQIEQYVLAGGHVHDLDLGLTLQTPERAAEELAARVLPTVEVHSTALLRSPNSPDQVAGARALGASLGLSGVEVSQRISSTLAQAAVQVARQSGTGKLIALGGDTSAALTRACGVTHTVLVEELAPGLPSTYAPAEHLLLVLKSGSFGPPDFLLRAIASLQRSPLDRP
ncbi:four-carbon acid sugar kinase family protein [Deinococcus sp. QL22]|uniref:four-carbon acid sugar kinase family protein n=1 Tax=Deinococcus sp. QL22 TaxID=2939437 RepID=UPI002017FFD2|nr:four-carbon acid sugar kinase family protein [Deinococcus sp. QL22]UQN08925.1 hypothetical protein M1R55_20245 [Deinococcus sp. QL22]